MVRQASYDSGSGTITFPIPIAILIWFQFSLAWLGPICSPFFQKKKRYNILEFHEKKVSM
uniref:Uncharacterized protein n=1 Tax=Rhizophora mucronata TaxID=61149 RepID=A0A2P2NLV1_RHIMU